ncbi:MAG: small subunit ribosomal protein S6 [Candidatus Tokpelaia sp. JSC085]|nr:MAG: small subunit ribosomal protein S6 [Candidatus Tokpelaia sp. JSC085]
MALYEHVFLARQDMTPQQVEQLVEQYKGVIETGGGQVGRIENWGLRPLSYRIKKNRKAYYTLMNINAPPNTIFEVKRQMRINEDVLRFLTIRVEAHEETPSAMLARRDREERFNDERSHRSRRLRDQDIAAPVEEKNNG